MNPTITPQCGREPHLTGRLANEKGQRIDIGNVKSKSFKRVLRKAGLRDIRYHDLRHTYASQLFATGKPVTYVSQQLGDTTPVCPKSYGGTRSPAVLALLENAQTLPASRRLMFGPAAPVTRPHRSPGQAPRLFLRLDYPDG
ncbi:MAG: tyrosine-type recombinase/integrase [Acidobacteria bacterium]|nr:tyrosine-type recombinase/integrase [Acidobacteriota bacterium]